MADEQRRELLNSLVHVTRSRLRQEGVSLEEWNNNDVPDNDNSPPPVDPAEPLIDDVIEDPVNANVDTDVPDADVDDNLNVMAVTAADLLLLGRQFSALALRLDPFDGTSNVKDFLQDFDRYVVETGKSTPGDKLNCLISHLSGEARLWYRTQSDTTFATVKAGLEERFGVTTPQKHAIKTKIYGSKQQPGESFRSFVGRLQQMARNIDMGEPELVPIVLGGARAELRAHLAMARPATIKDILKLPVVADEDLISENPQYESLNLVCQQISQLGRQVAELGRPAYTPSRRGRSQQRRGNQRRQPSRQLTPGRSQAPVTSMPQGSGPSAGPASQRRTASRSPSLSRCGKCGSSRCMGNPCPANGRVCYKCNKPNHFARACRSRVVRFNQL